METKTLWHLPATALPEPASVVGPTFVTIWLFSSGALAYVFYYFLNKPSPTWPEFKSIALGSGLLSFWYLGITIDRWIHYDTLKVAFGYILFIPVWEFFHVLSTIFILWGTYAIVWKELDGRFTEKQQKICWLAAKVAILVVCMVSLFYTILYLALSIIWMEFVSLNTIADVATKRTQLELSMAALFFGFSLLTAGTAAVAIIWGSTKIDGKTRVVLFLATILLLARSIAQFALVAQAYGKKYTRQDRLLAKDISYGLLSTMYLLTMAFHAWSISTGFDKGSNDARLVQSDIRKHILTKLQTDTKHGRQQSLPFEELLLNVSESLDAILSQRPQSSSSTLNLDQKREVAMEYIRHLRDIYGELDPKDGRDFNSLGSRNSSAFSSIFGGRSMAGGRRTVSNPEVRSAMTPGGVSHVRSREMPNRFTPRMYPPVPEDR
ncbi:hypothetical protein G7Z17_g1669 [Cylindrodendrum hubeiense]|uniref:Uncharacterized protein n=1 Tax=Cylindrodendrum hubeiense TaxID=595255 RepID=A0A9P5HPV1_9HYPO|nr:hypothetical protein G7Z17_g1669 [Cylindrodendrum hubeiense]